MNAIKVNDLAHLRELIKGGKNRFHIRLNFGLRSSKFITLSGSDFCVFNEIDGTDDIFTDEDMMNDRYTNIGKAITLNAFFCEC